MALSCLGPANDGHPLEFRYNHSQALEAVYLQSLPVLPYFAKSPFFDPTSNNAVLENQAMYNQNMVHVVATREAFEGRLKTMSGLEYIVAQEPAETAPGTGTGVWVIRKQTRRKRQGQEDEITVHSTYFVMGENIYMAPALLDVLGSRIVSRFNALFISASDFISYPSLLPSTNLFPPPMPYPISHRC
jgi:mediator of RNA polymerase II transcription subunit 6